MRQPKAVDRVTVATPATCSACGKSMTSAFAVKKHICDPKDVAAKQK